MPRKGQAFPIDDNWRGQVRSAIAERFKSEAAFARHARISKASLSEALSPGSKQSTLVPAIHRALGWPAPRPLLLSRDDEELLRLVSQLDTTDRAALRERAMTLLELRKKR